MVTTATLSALARRYAVPPSEFVESTEEYPDGPAVVLRTSRRSLHVRAVHEWLRAGQLPWVAAIVVVSRVDVDASGHEAAPFLHAFILPDAGDPIDLTDPAQVAMLGRRLRDGTLTPDAYAEILVECQWPAPGRRRLVIDPAAPPPDVPPGSLDRNGVRPLAMFDLDGDRWMAFCTVRQDPDTIGPGVEVTLWSVRAPAEGPAEWVRRLL